MSEKRPYGNFRARCMSSTVTTTTPLLEARGLVKRFGSLVANDAVDLTILPGEIHALLGENGAGKSTLVKMFFGSLQPDAGKVVWNGAPVSIRSPFEARALGIGMVFQHFSLFESLTVAQNIALSLESDAQLSTIAERARSLSVQYGLPLDPDALVGDLSAGERQRIEIIRCLMQDPRLVILDEPTSVLTPQEADTLFATLCRLRDEGRSVLYISHRLEEVQRLCSTATIMRQGRVVETCDPREETATTLAAKMVGSDIGDVARRGATRGDVCLSVRGLNVAAPHPFAVALEDISFDVHAGDVLAIAGIAGHGQGELFSALSGEIPLEDAAVISIDGNPCGSEGVTARRARRVAFVAEERLGHGAVPSMPLSQNMLLTRHSGSDGFSKRGVLFTTGLAKATQAVIEAFDVRKSAPNPPAASLSGGNLQKFLMGRELERELGLLVVNQPTWGVDAGAAARIRQQLVDLALAGTAVVVISQDLDEVFQIASHVAVMADGRLSDVESAASMSRERVGLMMAGLPADSGQVAA